MEILRSIGEPNPRVTPKGWLVIVGVLLITSTTITAWILMPLMRIEIQMIVGFPLWITTSGVLLSISSFLFLNRKKAFCRILSGTAAIAGGVLFFTLFLAIAGD